MSLVSTYVQSREGNWYQNPMIEGWIDGFPFFVCWDDDDPIEIVTVLPLQPFQVARYLIEEHGWNIYKEGKPFGAGYRFYFDKMFENRPEELPKCQAQFVRQNNKPPEKLFREQDKKLEEKPRGQGVFYGDY